MGGLPVYDARAILAERVLVLCLSGLLRVCGRVSAAGRGPLLCASWIDAGLSGRVVVPLARVVRWGSGIGREVCASTTRER